MQHKQNQDPTFFIQALAQASPDGELLKIGCLAELLDLSLDQPKSLLSFSCKAAEERLRKQPIFQEAALSKIKPRTLLVEYRLRRPIAFLGDYSNTALDDTGSLFPFHPFYTPKK